MKVRPECPETSPVAVALCRLTRTCGPPMASNVDRKLTERKTHDELMARTARIA
jgi:hypothetical protein